MAHNDIKKELHTYIDMIEDETKLQMLNEAAEAYASTQPDIIDILAPEQLSRLKESIKQADEGELISHDDAMKLSKQWLTK